MRYPFYYTKKHEELILRAAYTPSPNGTYLRSHPPFVCAKRRYHLLLPLKLCVCLLFIPTGRPLPPKVVWKGR